MFEITFFDKRIRTQLENPIQTLPTEVCQELTIYLNALQNKGEVSKADFYSGFGRGVFVVSGNTFELHFTKIENKIQIVKFNSLLFGTIKR
jgi:phage-related protein